MDCKCITLVLLFGFLFAFMHCQGQTGQHYNPAEEQKCLEHAATENTNVTEIRKGRKLDCKFVCVFQNGSIHTLNSPVGQNCSLLLSSQTGHCNDKGECNPTIIETIRTGITKLTTGLTG